MGKGHGPLLAKGSQALPDEQKDTTGWRTQFDGFLDQIDELRPKAGEPEYKYVHGKATGLQAALRVAPPGPERDKVIGRLVALLGSSNMQQESVLEWYAQVQRTASSMRSLGPDANAKFLDELERSGHTILSFYAYVSKVVPEHK
jgi:hypothetical protein